MQWLGSLEGIQMRVKVEAGNLVISIASCLDELEPEEKRKFVDSLACEEEIIADVTSQVLDGWTENGSHGLKGGAEVEPHTALEKAIREVALRASDVARKEIENLVRALRWEKAASDCYRDWGFSLYHKWPRDYPGCEMPPAVGRDEELRYEVVKRESA